ICGTDLHIYNWDEWSRKNIKPPLVIGHEYVGRVVEVGSMVSTIEVGDLVSGEGHIVCGVCRNCRAGRRVLCPNTKGVGVNRDGAFAEYIVIPEQNVVKILDGVPEDIVALFDPFGNAVHTALMFPLVGEDVLVTGAGPIGIMAAAVARFCGARNVVLTDIMTERLELAHKVVPDIRTVNTTQEDLRDLMPELKMTEGFDIGLEMSGSASALNEMIDTMITGGKIAMLGFQKAGTTVDWNKVVMGSLTLRGIYGRDMFETWYKMMALVQAGLDLSPIITHRFDFRDYEKGFTAMNSGKSGKVLLDWTSARD
ncbi:MAG: L-threonine 3-dehydrogenase, partial [Eubacteriales bacterium]|nr:L-threonine 3-dehydrogenase [Eubacteriales bacterium]